MAHVTYKGKKIDVKNNILDLSNRWIEDITDIKGLNQLTELHELNLNSNHITMIKGLENLKELQKLSLYWNGISEIRGLENLINLEILNISNPRAYLSYDRSGDAYLQSRNYISPISEIKGLENLVKLKVLNLKGNGIRIIKGLENLTNLKKLNLSKNEIRTIQGLENLTNLEKLNLSENKITTITGLSTLSNLRVLYVDRKHREKYLRPLTHKYFPIKGLKKLKNLMKIDIKCNWEFEINDYIRVKLPGGTREPTVYIAGKRYRDCVYLAYNTPTEKYEYVDEINSMDDIQIKEVFAGRNDPEERFWGICSNLQAWAEDNYNTNLLSRFLAFPLLKKLTEAGHPIAKSVFKDEIAKRFKSGHVHVAIFLLEEGYIDFFNDEEKEILFKEIVKTLENRSPGKWNNLGNRFKEIGQLDRAIDSYNKALEFDPDYRYACFNLGLIYTEKGEIEKAIEAYERAVEIDPKYHLVFYNLAFIYRGRDELDRAINSFKRVLEINPEHFYSWFNLGEVYDEMGELDQAIDSYKKALEIKPNYHFALHNLGIAYKKKGELEKAIEVIKHSLEFYPEDHHAWNNLGMAYEKQGSFDKAIECYKRALEINKEDETALEKLKKLKP